MTRQQLANCTHYVMTLALVLSLCGCHSADDSKRHAHGGEVRPYGVSYNFTVVADSLALLRQQPEEVLGNMPADTIYVAEEDHIAVADIRIMPDDTKDTVWVQVARDQHTFGWTHETELMAAVVPSDPISRFIHMFSNTRTIIFLAIVSLTAACCLFRGFRERNMETVHMADIGSPYPAMLAVMTAIAATMHSSIRMFAPDQWHHFYFHPTLNPFEVPGLTCAFLSLLWLMIIVAIAAIDEVCRRLPTGRAMMYLMRLAAVCAADYMLFTIATLAYIGYVMLAAYITFAAWAYVKNGMQRYRCGNCGAWMRHKGICPECGTLNE